jgi:predicted alpha/beta-fold hydrolase
MDATVGPDVKSSQKQGKENQKLIQWITAFCSSSSSSASSSIAIAIVFLNEAIRRRSLTSLPLVYHQSTDQNKILQSLMSPALMRSYKPSLFIGTRSTLNSAHAYMKKAAAAASGSHPNQWQWREEIKCARDGALVALDWKVPRIVSVSVNVSSQGPQQQQRQIREYVREGPIQESIVLILHGVNTDTSFGYMQSMMNACVENGWIAVGMNQRGCGGVGLSTPRFANSAYTNDLRYVRAWRRWGGLGDVR